MSAARATAQMKTVTAFIDAWKRLSLEDMVAVQSPDGVYKGLPEATLGWPEQTPEEWLAAMRPMFGALSNFEPTILSITNDGEAGRTVIHAKTAADAPWGPYRNEHVIIMSFNEDGTKVMKLEDMLDSAEVQKMFGQIAEHNSKQPQI